MGMVNKNEKNMTPLTELQVMAFALQELALYLDTHRDDQEALELYRTYQRMYHDASAKYAMECTPLQHSIPTEGPTAGWTIRGPGNTQKIRRAEYVCL
jgi:spore coat protein JB